MALQIKLASKILDWWCKKVWLKFDNQKQILGIQLDITNACNLSCVHCYHFHHKNTGALELNDWIAILIQYRTLLKKMRMMPRITICGGEPLLCSFLPELLQWIRAEFPTCLVMLLTNGTRITQPIAKKFRELDVSIQISMDGPDADRHDSIRGCGSFSKMLLGCEQLREQGVWFNHLAVLSKRTSAWIPDFFSVAHTTGAKEMNFIRLVPDGNAINLIGSGKDDSLTGEALKEAYGNILQHSRSAGIPTSTRGALWHLMDGQLGSPNNIGINSMVISYKGEMKVSSRTSYVLGDVRKDGLEQLFCKHPIMQRLRKGDIAGCGNCEFFRRCRGDRNASFGQFGHFFGPDPGCWILQP